MTRMGPRPAARNDHAGKRRPQRTAKPLYAIQEELGLKLEATNAPFDVMVIDHVEKPPANQAAKIVFSKT